ncbi:molybdopterin molybdotransferase MoeA [Nocardiopsis sp. RSe5-2]|uniref:Molybdopterin molybdenumtransferase n=1 Tax=Nocardiopsis endophytica TaxID=3018445 RepID=A0ABT4TWW0_9ACTN|nr:gephyrin-like molybdotransferase Glp [Nocardiopsis endophytica]MDA2809178.1 molybdopterin molybdotransferase MoeA [Nocardiopsis endophytica]
MKSVERHISDILGLVRPLPPIELDLLRAQGAVLAEDVAAPVALPPFDNSGMDGYAVVAADVAGASGAAPVRLPVAGDIAAGDTGAHAVRSGYCARIMTGAPMPAGADAVVPVEWTDGGRAEVAVHRPAAAGNAVRRAGGDVGAGDTVLRAGARLGAAELGVLASVGRRTAPVHPRPRVAVLSTGEELVEPGKPLAPGQIWESNGYMLTAAAITAGCDGHRHSFVGDEPSAVLDAIDDVLMQADIVVTTGGVSMGAYDPVKEALAGLGTVRFEQVAMQPGKPQGFGTVGEDATPIITLPGNPVSAFVSFYVLLLPALRRMQGVAPDPLPTVSARLSAPVSSPPGRRSYLRVRLEEAPGADGPTAVPASRQASHQLSALADADGLAMVPEDAETLPEGTEVAVLRLPRP